LENFVKNQSDMEVITMESRVYKDLIDKIDKISAFVVKCEAGCTSLVEK